MKIPFEHSNLTFCVILTVNLKFFRVLLNFITETDVYYLSKLFVYSIQNQLPVFENQSDLFKMQIQLQL